MLLLCADGGGSKLRMLACHDRLGLLAQVSGPAASIVGNDPRRAAADAADTVARLLQQLPAGLPRTPGGRLIVDKMFVTSVGVDPARAVARMARLRRRERLNEAAAGLLAGVGSRSGVLTLAGTGSDSFFIGEDQQMLAVGGYGPILGDEGSGYDMGRQALMAAILADEGRGAPTLLREYIFSQYGLREQLFELVHIVHSPIDGRAQVARATYALGRAAREGDTVALHILRDAGRRLADNTVALLHKVGAAGSACPATVSGGAWKVHPLLWATFRRQLLTACPALQLRAPLFEPVMAGVVLAMMGTGDHLDEQQLARLARHFAPLTLRQWFDEGEAALCGAADGQTV